MSDTKTDANGTHPPSGRASGPLEGALFLAAEAGQWAIVAQLAKELEARRHDAEGVLSLDAERARRKPK